MSRHPTRVLVCDESRRDAVLLQRLLEHDGTITVVGFSATGAEAVRAVVDARPDLVAMAVAPTDPAALLGVELIMTEHPLPILVVSDVVSSELRDAALAAGALEALARTALDLEHPGSDAAAELRRRVILLSRSVVIRHPRGGIAAQRGRREAARPAAVVAICASTGGPHALRQLFEALPAGYSIPVLVVQHISRGSTENLVQWLNEVSAVPVNVAVNGTRAEPGIWLAPDDAHLKLTRSGLLTLDPVTVRGVHRPSGDVLLESVASVAGRFGVGIVLTGMGDDGAAGVGALHRAGGFCIAQDEASSVVYGMPRAALAAGADLALTLPQIAVWLSDLRPHAAEAAA